MPTSTRPLLRGVTAVPELMTAVLLTGHGGLDRLEVRHDVPVPLPGPGEVLIEVGAAGVNNTDINTRVGWYSKGVTGPTSSAGEAGFPEAEALALDAGWTGLPLEFPLIAAAEKAEEVAALGAARVLPRDADVLGELGRESVDAVIDVVGGRGFPSLLELLRKGGRYATAGAIAGPLVELDLRTLYLNDLTLLGCTRQEAGVFERLLAYVEGGEIRPLVAHVYPLEEIATAQQDFLAKRFLGKLVLVPPKS